MGDGRRKETARPGRWRRLPHGGGKHRLRRPFQRKILSKNAHRQGGNIANVTFAPACRNDWHIHRRGSQILLVTGGRGYYRAWGEPARKLRPGDVVNIPPDVKRWHGAAPDGWFPLLAVEVPADGGATEWLESVDG